MAYRKPQRYFSFADLAVEKHADKNRALAVLKQLNLTIDWNPIKKLLDQFYQTGKQIEGGKAYPPSVLFKCLLLQKWFQIPSDPELESQINDRISFKSFLGLPLGQAAPAHSTFSRFRNSLSKQAMIKLNSALLAQLHQHGITVNEGVAIDARLFKSASKPVSNDKLTELRDKNADPDGNLDKNGNPKKFSRDLESDWTIKNDVPHFGLKEHAAVEVGKGLILSTTLTPASHSDSTYLPYATIYSMHTDQKINVVYADKGYAGSPNRNFLAMNQIADGIMRKNNINACLTQTEIARNKSISKKRYIVEQYFDLATLFDDRSRARFTTIVKNSIDAMFRQFAFNLRKGAWILRRLTSKEFTSVLKDNDIAISMDGRGRIQDNIFIERLWWTLKHQHIYLHSFDDGAQLRTGLSRWFEFYNKERPHQGLDGHTPDEVYFTTCLPVAEAA